MGGEGERRGGGAVMRRTIGYVVLGGVVSGVEWRESIKVLIL